MSVEHILGFVVANALDDLAHRALDVHIRLFAADFAAHDDQSGRTKGLTGDLRLAVLGKELIQNGIGNLIRYFVGVSLGHALRREEIILFHFSIFLSGCKQTNLSTPYCGCKGR